MSGSLSQEEIDALMKQGADGEPGTEAEPGDVQPPEATTDGEGSESTAEETVAEEPVEAALEAAEAEAAPTLVEDEAPAAVDAPDADADGLSPDECDALGEIGNISMSSAATSLSELLGHEVSITTPRVSVVSDEEIRAEQPRPTTLVLIDFIAGLSGRSALVLPIADASVVADLMMGGEGQASAELDEMQTSAVAEAMNQMMGAAATAMADLVGERVDISTPVVQVLDMASPDVDIGVEPGEMLVRVAFDLVVGDKLKTELMQLMPLPFSRELVSGLLGSSGSASAEAEPSPLEGQPAPPPTLDLPTPAPASPAPLAQPVSFPALDEAGAGGAAGDIGLLLDVPLSVTVELGRTQLRIRNVLDLVPGSIVELDKLAGEPVDVMVNGKQIARGEVVVIDEEFGVRITAIASQDKRLSGLTAG